MAETEFLMDQGFNQNSIITNAAVIFWDFDGVIKDSLDVKTKAFEILFLLHGEDVASQVREHHESNGGISRFEKMPLYLSWADEPATSEQVVEYCDRFAKSVKQSVIDAPWVPGVRVYLLQHFSEQYFVLVTATPQEEIEEILNVLEIKECFAEIYGAPTKKKDAIGLVLRRQKFDPSQALMIGDAEADMSAAAAHSVPFLLRRTPQNVHLQQQYFGPMFDDLSHE
jgi:phosphoglycolate phosphatase-like HAD superfamily hydrolase